MKYPAQGSKSYEDANIPVFRLSELYLNAAEAAIKRNDIPNTRKYLKPIYARTGKDLDAVADEDINLDLVLEQRRIEFWGEGQRFFDLLRNNKKVIREDYLIGVIIKSFFLFLTTKWSTMRIWFRIRNMNCIN